MEEITRFDMDMDGSMESSDHGQWVRYEDVSQRTWVGLTPEDTFEIGERLGLSDIAWVDLMQAIEAKLKEKNNG